MLSRVEKEDMKRGRKLTCFEKSCVQKQGKNPKDYVYAYKVSDSYFKIRHKQTGIEAIVNVFDRSKNKWDY